MKANYFGSKMHQNQENTGEINGADRHQEGKRREKYAETGRDFTEKLPDSDPVQGKSWHEICSI